jgi:hypothetical protein
LRAALQLSASWSLEEHARRRDGKAPKQKLAGANMGRFAAKRNEKSRLTQKFHTTLNVKSYASKSA